MREYKVMNLNTAQFQVVQANNCYDAVLTAYGRSIGDNNEPACLLSRYGHKVSVGKLSVSCVDYACLREHVSIA